ncbi:MAG: phage tail tape measure protein, partial [Oscillospiraceae bacterium]|nr:phage tail tape measure protein [Oscillospiraceae bacterium]
MAKNEAKIKFQADTSQFNAQIKKSNDTMSQLKAELKLNETQMKATGTTVEGLENKHKLLSSQLSESEEKTNALSQKVQKAVEIFGENSAEAVKLKTQLAKAQTEQENLKQAVDGCNTELEKQREAEKQAESATDQLTNTINSQEEELNKLKSEYTEAVLQYGKTSDQAQDLSRQIKELTDSLDNNKEKMSDAEYAADDLSDELKDVENSTEKASDGFTVMKGVAANLITEGLNKLTDAAGKVVDAFYEVDEGADNVIRATGATGDSAQLLKDSYEKVASSVVGDFGDIGSALGEVNTRFGYTGGKLEKCTIDFLKFSEITGVDSTEAVQSVSRALNDAGIPLDDYGSLLDQLAKAGQAAGIDLSVLTDGLSKNGATMRAMGFNTEETIALLAQFELSGADTSTMLAGMKKAMSKWADSGKDASTEFSKMVSGIKDGSMTASDAIDVFGTKAGPQLVDAIKSGKFAYEDLLDVIKDSKGTTENTFDELTDGGYDAELAMQNAKIAFSEIGDVVLTTVSPAFDDITEIIREMADGFSEAVEWCKEHKAVLATIATVIGIVTTAVVAYNIVQGIQTAMNTANVATIWALVSAHMAQAAAAMAAIAPYLLIVAAIAAVIAIIVVCVKHWDQIKEATTNAMAKMKQSVSDAIENIVGFFKDALGWIKNNWQGLLLLIINPFAGAFKLVYDNCEGFRTKVDDFIGKIKELFRTGFETVKTNIIDPIRNAKDNALSAIEDLKTNVGNKITAMKSSVSTTFDKIKSAIITPIQKARDQVKTFVDAIKGFFSGMKLTLPHIKLPHFKLSGSLSLSPPSVPKLNIEWYKDGAILTRPTIFGMNGLNPMVGGE